MRLGSWKLLGDPRLGVPRQPRNTLNLHVAGEEKATLSLRWSHKGGWEYEAHVWSSVDQV